MPLSSGQMLSHYRIAGKIGAGGMGEVYRAEDTRLGRHVALKVLPQEMASDPRRLSRLQREARAVAALNHPNIVTLFSVEEAEGARFLTMELVEGRSLSEHITLEGLPLDRLLDLAGQLSAALAAAHERGISHRDLKPSNVMISDDGRIKVLDFGLAKLLPEIAETGASQLPTEAVSQEGLIVGTLPYMSPEQLEGRATDHRTDIFSLGVILYEMATGARPFTGESSAALVSSIMKDSPPPVTRGRDALPAELDRIITRCLMKEPDRRYATVRDLGDDLRALAESGLASSGSKPGPTPGGVPSIAVLPFADMSPAKDQEYFCEGIAEELIGGLNRLDGLQVASRTSAFQFRGKGHNICEIGQKLRVRTVLEGSVRKAGNRVRITAQLVNVSDGFHLWSEKFDRDLDDIFGIQDEISLAIVESLRIRLLGGEKERLVKRHTRNPDAHSLYLKGRYFWNRRYEVGLRTALEYFQRALEKDPGYALPHVGVADSYIMLGWFGFMPPGEAFPRAKAAASRALELDDSLGEAHASLGFAIMAWDWDWDASEREYQRAIELTPDYATGHEWYGLLLSVRKQFSEATSELRRSQELDPLSVVIGSVYGVVLYMARRYDESVVELQRALEMDPDFAFARAWLGECLHGKGHPEDGLREVEKAAELAPDMTYILSFLGWIQGSTGRHEQARRTLERLDQIARDRYVSPFHFGLVHAGMGDTGRALEGLHKACAMREPLLVFADTFPFLDDVRADPRFPELLRKIGLRP